MGLPGCTAARSGVLRHRSSPIDVLFGEHFEAESEHSLRHGHREVVTRMQERNQEALRTDAPLMVDVPLLTFSGSGLGSRADTLKHTGAEAERIGNLEKRLELLRQRLRPGPAVEVAQEYLSAGVHKHKDCEGYLQVNGAAECSERSLSAFGVEKERHFDREVQLTCGVLPSTTHEPLQVSGLGGDTNRFKYALSPELLDFLPAPDESWSQLEARRRAKVIS